MKQEELLGKVQTVLGPVNADALGVTLPHEHLLIDARAYFAEPTVASEKKMAHEPISLNNLFWIKTHWHNHLDNISLDDEETAIKEALLYKRAGGDTIVEVTSGGLCRDPLRICESH